MILSLYEVLGIWDCTQKCLVAARIPDRSAATMRPLFHFFCNPGIQITTDAWKGYNFLRREGWRHMMVVHKRYDALPKCDGMYVFVILRNFVCPLTGAHTNNVERTWRPMKRYFSLGFCDIADLMFLLRMFRNARRVTLSSFDSYLYSWLFRYNLERSGMRDDQVYDEIDKCLV